MRLPALNWIIFSLTVDPFWKFVSFVLIQIAYFKHNKKSISCYWLSKKLLDSYAETNSFAYYLFLLYDVELMHNLLQEDYELTTSNALPAMNKIHMDYDEIHKRLRKTRKALDLELKDAASVIDIDPQYLGQLEMNRSPGVWEHIVNLAYIYNTTTDYLLDAPWAKNPERIPGSAHTKEAMAAMRIIDQYPPAVRVVLLESLEKLAEVMSSLVDQARENIQLRLTLSEYSTRLTEEEIRVSDSTVAERLAQLLSADES